MTLNEVFWAENWGCGKPINSGDLSYVAFCVGMEDLMEDFKLSLKI
jgi:hypothetical protein